MSPQYIYNLHLFLPMPVQSHSYTSYEFIIYLAFRQGAATGRSRRHPTPHVPAATQMGQIRISKSARYHLNQADSARLDILSQALGQGFLFY